VQSINIVPSLPSRFLGVVPFQEHPVGELAQQLISGIAKYNEFYCTAGGSNLNAGSDTNNSAKFTSTNGGWSTTTKVFTPSDGTNPVAAGVQPGDWASIYVDGASVAVYVALVIAVQNQANGTITTDATHASGSAPSTLGTTRTIKVGGAWRGPNGSQTWPFSIAMGASLNDANGNWPRINLKNDQTYSISVGLGPSGVNTVIQGYSSVPGDGGRATIDAGGANIDIVTPNSTSMIFADLIIQNNGTGTGHGLTTGSGLMILYRVVVNNVRGNGINIGAVSCSAIECETYACNQSNTSGGAGMVMNAGNVVIACISHDNTGTNSDGFNVISGNNPHYFLFCISAKNGRHGYSAAPGVNASLNIMMFCDAYGNGGDGLKNLNTTGASSIWLIRNCNFIANTGFGINSSLTTGKWLGLVDNCGFGVGTAYNRLGKTFNTESLVFSGTIDYPNNQVPYLDPVNGKFDIVLAQAINAGRGAFTETAASYGPTNSYPPIGGAPGQPVTSSWAGINQVLPAGSSNLAYEVDFNFISSATVSLQSGSLPTGLNLVTIDTTHAVLSGTPTVPGTFDFVLRLTVGASYGDATFHITIS